MCEQGRGVLAVSGANCSQTSTRHVVLGSLTISIGLCTPPHALNGADWTNAHTNLQMLNTRAILSVVMHSQCTGSLHKVQFDKNVHLTLERFLTDCTYGCKHAWSKSRKTLQSTRV
eukprot:1140451-Amphidinium_carterae.1